MHNRLKTVAASAKKSPEVGSEFVVPILDLLISTLPASAVLPGVSVGWFAFVTYQVLVVIPGAKASLYEVGGLLHGAAVRPRRGPVAGRHRHRSGSRRSRLLLGGVEVGREPRR